MNQKLQVQTDGHSIGSAAAAYNSSEILHNVTLETIDYSEREHFTEEIPKVQAFSERNCKNSDADILAEIHREELSEMSETTTTSRDNEEEFYNGRNETMKVFQSKEAEYKNQMTSDSPAYVMEDRDPENRRLCDLPAKVHQDPNDGKAEAGDREDYERMTANEDTEVKKSDEEIPEEQFNRQPTSDKQEFKFPECSQTEPEALSTPDAMKGDEEERMTTEENKEKLEAALVEEATLQKCELVEHLQHDSYLENNKGKRLDNRKYTEKEILSHEVIKTSDIDENSALIEERVGEEEKLEESPNVASGKPGPETQISIEEQGKTSAPMPVDESPVLPLSAEKSPQENGESTNDQTAVDDARDNEAISSPRDEISVVPSVDNVPEEILLDKEREWQNVDKENEAQKEEKTDTENSDASPTTFEDEIQPPNEAKESEDINRRTSDVLAEERIRHKSTEEESLVPSSYERGCGLLDDFSSTQFANDAHSAYEEHNQEEVLDASKPHIESHLKQSEAKSDRDNQKSDVFDNSRTESTTDIEAFHHVNFNRDADNLPVDYADRENLQAPNKHVDKMINGETFKPEPKRAETADENHESLYEPMAKEPEKTEDDLNNEEESMEKHVEESSKEEGQEPHNNEIGRVESMLRHQHVEITDINVETEDGTHTAVKIEDDLTTGTEVEVEKVVTEKNWISTDSPCESKIHEVEKYADVKEICASTENDSMGEVTCDVSSSKDCMGARTDMGDAGDNVCATAVHKKTGSPEEVAEKDIDERTEDEKSMENTMLEDESNVEEREMGTEAEQIGCLKNSAGIAGDQQKSIYGEAAVEDICLVETRNMEMCTPVMQKAKWEDKSVNLFDAVSEKEIMAEERCSMEVQEMIQEQHNLEKSEVNEQMEQEVGGASIEGPCCEQIPELEEISQRADIDDGVEMVNVKDADSFNNSEVPSTYVTLSQDVHQTDDQNEATLKPGVEEQIQETTNTGEMIGTEAKMEAHSEVEETESQNRLVPESEPQCKSREMTSETEDGMIEKSISVVNNQDLVKDNYNQDCNVADIPLVANTMQVAFDEKHDKKAETQEPEYMDQIISDSAEYVLEDINPEERSTHDLPAEPTQDQFVGKYETGDPEENEVKDEKKSEEEILEKQPKLEATSEVQAVKFPESSQAEPKDCVSLDATKDSEEELKTIVEEKKEFKFVPLETASIQNSEQLGECLQKGKKGTCLDNKEEDSVNDGIYMQNEMLPQRMIKTADIEQVHQNALASASAEEGLDEEEKLKESSSVAYGKQDRETHVSIEEQETAIEKGDTLASKSVNESPLQQSSVGKSPPNIGETTEYQIASDDAKDNVAMQSPRDEACIASFVENVAEETVLNQEGEQQIDDKEHEALKEDKINAENSDTSSTSIKDLIESPDLEESIWPSSHKNRLEEESSTSFGKDKQSAYEEDEAKVQIVNCPMPEASEDSEHHIESHSNELEAKSEIDSQKIGVLEESQTEPTTDIEASLDLNADKDAEDLSVGCTSKENLQEAPDKSIEPLENRVSDESSEHADKRINDEIIKHVDKIIDEETLDACPKRAERVDITHESLCKPEPKELETTEKDLNPKKESRENDKLVKHVQGSSREEEKEFDNNEVVTVESKPGFQHAGKTDITIQTDDELHQMESQNETTLKPGLQEHMQEATDAEDTTVIDIEHAHVEQIQKMTVKPEAKMIDSSTDEDHVANTQIHELADSSKKTQTTKTENENEDRFVDMHKSRAESTDAEIVSKSIPDDQSQEIRASETKIENSTNNDDVDNMVKGNENQDCDVADTPLVANTMQVAFDEKHDKKAESKEPEYMDQIISDSAEYALEDTNPEERPIHDLPAKLTQDPFVGKYEPGDMEENEVNKERKSEEEILEKQHKIEATSEVQEAKFPESSQDATKDSEEEIKTIVEEKKEELEVVSLEAASIKNSEHLGECLQKGTCLENKEEDSVYDGIYIQNEMVPQGVIETADMEQVHQNTSASASIEEGLDKEEKFEESSSVAYGKQVPEIHVSIEEQETAIEEGDTLALKSVNEFPLQQLSVGKTLPDIGETTEDQIGSEDARDNVAMESPRDEASIAPYVEYVPEETILNLEGEQEKDKSGREEESATSLAKDKQSAYDEEQNHEKVLDEVKVQIVNCPTPEASEDSENHIESHSSELETKSEIDNQKTGVLEASQTEPTTDTEASLDLNADKDAEDLSVVYTSKENLQEAPDASSEPVQNRIRDESSEHADKRINNEIIKHLYKIIDEETLDPGPKRTATVEIKHESLHKPEPKELETTEKDLNPEKESRENDELVKHLEGSSREEEKEFENNEVVVVTVESMPGFQHAEKTDITIQTENETYKMEGQNETTLKPGLKEQMQEAIDAKDTTVIDIKHAHGEPIHEITVKPEAKMVGSSTDEDHVANTQIHELVDSSKEIQTTKMENENEDRFIDMAECTEAEFISKSIPDDQIQETNASETKIENLTNDDDVDNMITRKEDLGESAENGKVQAEGNLPETDVNTLSVYMLMSEGAIDNVGGKHEKHPNMECEAKDQITSTKLNVEVDVAHDQQEIPEIISEQALENQGQQNGAETETTEIEKKTNDEMLNNRTSSLSNSECSTEVNMQKDGEEHKIESSEVDEYMEKQISEDDMIITSTSSTETTVENSISGEESRISRSCLNQDEKQSEGINLDPNTDQITSNNEETSDQTCEPNMVAGRLDRSIDIDCKEHLRGEKEASDAPNDANIESEADKHGWIDTQGYKIEWSAAETHYRDQLNESNEETHPIQKADGDEKPTDSHLPSEGHNFEREQDNEPPKISSEDAETKPAPDEDVNRVNQNNGLGCVPENDESYLSKSAGDLTLVCRLAEETQQVEKQHDLCPSFSDVKKVTESMDKKVSIDLDTLRDKVDQHEETSTLVSDDLNQKHIGEIGVIKSETTEDEAMTSETSFAEDKEEIHELKEVSKSSESLPIEDAKTNDGAAVESSKQPQGIMDEKQNDGYKPGIKDLLQGKDPSKNQVMLEEEECLGITTANQEDNPVTVLSTAEAIKKEIVEGVKMREESTEATDQENPSITLDHISNNSNSEELISQIEASSAHPQVDNIETEEKCETINNKHEELQEQNETSVEDSKKDTKECVGLEYPEMIFERTETNNSNEKFEEITGKDNRGEYLETGGLEDEVTKEHSREEANTAKNTEAETLSASQETHAMTNQNYEVEESDLAKSETNLVRVNEDDKAVNESSTVKENPENNIIVPPSTIALAEETVSRELGEVLVRGYESEPKEYNQETVYANKKAEELATEETKSTEGTTESASVQETCDANDVTDDNNVKGEGIPNNANKFFVATQASAGNSINTTFGEAVAEKVAVDESESSPSKKIENENSESFSAIQTTDVSSLQDTSNIVDQVTELNHEVRKSDRSQGKENQQLNLSDLPGSRFLMDHILRGEGEPTEVSVSETENKIEEEQTGDNENNATIPEEEHIVDSFSREKEPAKESISENKELGKIEISPEVLHEEQRHDAKGYTEIAAKPAEDTQSLPPSIMGIEEVEAEVSNLVVEQSTGNLTTNCQELMPTEESTVNLVEDEKLFEAVGKLKTTESAVPNNNDNQNKDVKDLAMIGVCEGNLLQGGDRREFSDDCKHINEDAHAILQDQAPTKPDLLKSSSCLVQSEELFRNPQCEQTDISQPSTTEDTKHGEDEASDVKEVTSREQNDESTGNQVKDDSEEPKPSSLEKVRPSEFMQVSKHEAVKLVEHISEERSPPVITADWGTEKAAGTKVEEQETGEEKDERVEDDPQKTEENAPMIVGSRDAGLKPAHKKSHNILSGVGSKVKHSIAKMKMAITCNSAHHTAI